MGAVASIMNTVPINDAVVKHWKEKAGDRKTVVFCSTVQHAQDVAASFNAAGVPAVFVHGEMSDTERSNTLEAYTSGEARKSNLYTSNMFCQVWEHKAGLGGRHSIRDRIEVLTSKGYIKFVKDGAARSRNGYLCVEGMEVPTDQTDVDPTTGEITPVFKRVLPTHFRSPSDGVLMPIEDPEVWIYHEGVSE